MRDRGGGSRFKEDRGGATVLVMAVLGGLLVLLGAVAVSVDVAHTKSQASTAADMAALAGARELLLGEPCGTAQDVAQANRSRMEQCDLDGEDVQVVVKTPLEGAAGSVFRAVRIGNIEVTAVSRAGPPACDRGLISLGIRC